MPPTASCGDCCRATRSEMRSSWLRCRCQTLSSTSGQWFVIILVGQSSWWTTCRVTLTIVRCHTHLVRLLSLTLGVLVRLSGWVVIGSWLIAVFTYTVSGGRFVSGWMDACWLFSSLSVHWACSWPTYRCDPVSSIKALTLTMLHDSMDLLSFFIHWQTAEGRPCQTPSVMQVTRKTVAAGYLTLTLTLYMWCVCVCQEMCVYFPVDVGHVEVYGSLSVRLMSVDLVSH